MRGKTLSPHVPLGECLDDPIQEALQAAFNLASDADVCFS